MNDKPIKSQSRKREREGFRLEPDIKERLDAISLNTGIPKSWFLNQALRRQLPELEKIAKELAT